MSGYRRTNKESFKMKVSLARDHRKKNFRRFRHLDTAVSLDQDGEEPLVRLYDVTPRSVFRDLGVLINLTPGGLYIRSGSAVGSERKHYVNLWPFLP